MFRHRRWSTVAAFGLLVVGLVFLTGAWGATPRVRVLHPSAVAQTYGGAAALSCWAQENGICQEKLNNCGEVECVPVTYTSGEVDWKCPSDATARDQNVPGWYSCTESGSGKDGCDYLDTVYCVKVYTCQYAGAVGIGIACQKNGDKYYCTNITTGTPISYDKAKEEWITDWADPCPK